MPFKLKLKKSKQYSVVSKSLCVIGVKLLENSTVECILSHRTLGQECLSNVCQRLQIQQVDYFGLRYTAKDRSLRWIDLDRPLKKQLDKYAAEFCLYLGIQFYVFNTDHIRDEVTRYYYFSHLKSDIIEGRLRCTRDEAIQLASHSLQAEFGDHRPEHHTAEYLKNFALLPKHLLNTSSTDTLIEQVIQAHRNLQGMHHSMAEVYYIMTVQRLDGYGQEVFMVKDTEGNDVVLGVSALGVTMRYAMGSHEITKVFHWSEIIDLIHHKKFFKIEGRDSDRSAQFQLGDVATAKYIWKECVQQHKFFMTLKELECGSPRRPQEGPPVYYPPHQLNNNQNIASNGHRDSTVSELQGGVYHTVTQREERLPMTLERTSHLPSEQVSVRHRLSVTDEPDYENIPIVAAHGSCEVLPAMTDDDPTVEARRALLPPYRKAPDYETAIRHKNGVSCSLNDLSSIYVMRPQIASSHPSSLTNNEFSKSCNPITSYAQYGNYSDLRQLGTESPSAVNYQLQLTYSTPELNTVVETTDSCSALVPTTQLYKPPPPYPHHGRTSSSTPDLTRSVSNAKHGNNSRPDVLIRHAVPVSQAQRLGSESNLTLSHNGVANGGPAMPQFVAVKPTRQYMASSEEVSGKRDSIQSIPLFAENSHAHHVTHVNVNVPATSDAGKVQVYVSSVPVSSIEQSSTSSVSIATLALETPPPPYRKSFDDKEGSRSQNPIMLTSSPLASPRAVNDLPVTDVSVVTRPDVVPTVHHHQSQQSVSSNHGAPQDKRIHELESRLMEGPVFLEFEQIPKKKMMANFATAMLPENMARNRFKDVLPYEENRVRLGPSKDNRTGYINASHVSVSIGDMHRFYIAAQGPMENTSYHFWQMIWENNVSIVVMLTDIIEQGREKCYPYWPQGDEKETSKMTVKDFVIQRQSTVSSTAFTTSCLAVTHTPTRATRTVWHLQYTDWPDHGCPQDIHGFLSFMDELESVRRVSVSEGRAVRNAPIVMHCTAGVGRSGVVILCDLLLFCLDHNHPIDVPQALTYIRYQRMLSVQTLAQYKFVYQVMIQYLKNSRLI